MSAAALVQRLRTRAVPGLNQAERNGWNAGTNALPYREKQAALEGGTPIGTAGTAGTVIFTGVGRNGTESRPEQAANDAQAPAPALDWRQADAAYLRHHFACKTCCAAGHGRGTRCTTGADLWASYGAVWEAAQATNTKGRSAR